MAIELGGDELAAMCFRRVPSDVVPRDVILAALWHLYCEAAAKEHLIEGRTFRHTLLGKRAGLPARDYRAGLEELRREGLVGGANNGYCLTPKGFMAAGRLIDVERAIGLAKAA